MKKVWVVADLKDFSWDDFLLGYMVGGVLMGSATEVIGRKKSGSDITVKIFDKKEDVEKFLEEKRKKRVPVVFWEAFMPEPPEPPPEQPKPKSFKEFLLR